MKRKTYLPPETTVFGVEIESAICSGSIQMGDQEKQIVIDDQAIDKDNLDFTGSAWDAPASSN